MIDNDLPHPVRLDELSWSQIAALQEGGMRMLMLPTGATEQHGPHLPINTDSVIATRLTEAASSITGIPCLPVMTYTVSAGHTAKWPGTFSLRHETFIHSILDLVDWMVASGWKRLLVVNSHFGNDAVLRVAIDQLRLRHLNRLQIGMVNTFLLTPSIKAYFFADAEDLHANRAETDLMLHLAPDTVDMTAVEDDPDRTEGKVFSYPVSQTSLNGITGSPSEGTAEQGERLFREMAAALAEKASAALTETPPLDPSYWAGKSQLPAW
ncbi:MAG: creatininase family protein [Verrucomicrobiae bacterium]|nr:creatininase family protein [Verrucomicrobiae bacterium]